MKNVKTTKKAEKRDYTTVMGKLKVFGRPIDISDFWFYVMGDKKTVFHVTEGDGTNLNEDDLKEGFTDYIYYDIYKGDITYKKIDGYVSGDDPDPLANDEADGGMVLLYNPYGDLTLRQICWKVLDMAGYDPKNYLDTTKVIILSGHCADADFPTGKPHEHVTPNDKIDPNDVDNLLIAIWVKCGGDYAKIMHVLKDKIVISKEEIKILSSKEIEATKAIGGRIITVLDDEYPETFKLIMNPPFCFVVKDGRILLNKPLTSPDSEQ